MPPTGVVFLVGVVAAPLMPKILKPVLRGAIKAGTDLTIKAKRVAAEVTEDVQDIVAETSAKNDQRSEPNKHHVTAKH
jgi:hypothetical protein